MRRIALLAVLLFFSSCSTYYSAQAGYYILKCGGPGGEQDFERCTWRGTSVFARKQKPVPQPQHKEDVRQTHRSSS